MSPLNTVINNTSDKTEASDTPAEETWGHTHREDCQAPKRNHDDEKNEHKRRRLRGKQPVTKTDGGQVQHAEEKDSRNTEKMLDFINHSTKKGQQQAAAKTTTITTTR